MYMNIICDIVTLFVRKKWHALHNVNACENCIMTSSNGNIFPVNSPHKGQWRRALMFSLICSWINGWVKNGKAGDLIRQCAHYDVIVMVIRKTSSNAWCKCLWKVQSNYAVVTVTLFFKVMYYAMTHIYYSWYSRACTSGKNVCIARCKCLWKLLSGKLNDKQCMMQMPVKNYITIVYNKLRCQSPCFFQMPVNSTHIITRLNIIRWYSRSVHKFVLFS